MLDGGWVEFHEFIPQILCDDGSMHQRDPLKVLIDTSSLGLRKFGGEPLRGLKLDEALMGAGFTNIHTITKKVPIGPWPTDKHLKFIGMCMRTALSQSLGALAAKPMTTLGMPLEVRRALVTEAKRSLSDRRMHRHMKCVICYGQKNEIPESATSRSFR